MGAYDYDYPAYWAAFAAQGQALGAYMHASATAPVAQWKSRVAFINANDLPLVQIDQSKNQLGAAVGWPPYGANAANPSSVYDSISQWWTGTAVYPRYGV